MVLDVVGSIPITRPIPLLAPARAPIAWAAGSAAARMQNDAILFANDSFYRAFAARDAVAMEAL